jgi:HlyD family secretion protein
MVERMPETTGAAEQPPAAATAPAWRERTGKGGAPRARLAKRVAAGAAVLLVAAAAAFLAWRGARPAGPGPGFVSGNGRIEAIEVDIATRQRAAVASGRAQLVGARSAVAAAVATTARIDAELQS